jgi:SAM-dependent methyltransferase/pimeloyl-ACP methyl ester carboxylesterase
MLSRSTPIHEGALRRLHPDTIEDPQRIRALLVRARDEAVPFHRGLNHRADLETATLEEVLGDELIFRAPNFERAPAGAQVFLNFTFEGRPFFFATWPSAGGEASRLRVVIPQTIFFGERRDRARRAPDGRAGDPRRVEVEDGQGGFRQASVADVSPSGLGLLMDTDVIPDRPLTVRFLDGRESGKELQLELRNRKPVEGRKGWIRLGLARTRPSAISPIEIEDFDPVPEHGAASVRPEEPVAEPQVVRIANSEGEEIVGLIDAWGESRGRTAVVMPNGWGQTKEALLPLARTLVETFRYNEEPVLVLRYDGIRRRGESYNDPDCRLPGSEASRFVFSQGIRDLETSVAFVRESPEWAVSKVIVVSFSAAAIEVRKAVARDRGRTIDGWVSVVGSPDLQSMSRSISGGVDFVAGHELGLEFGLQELLGVTLDVDKVVEDAQAHAMSFIEDSGHDLEQIDIPITWYHGRYDAWVDLSRVQTVLSHGDTRRRRLVVMPTGHQLRTSHQASQAFGSIAREVGRMALGRELVPAAPPAGEVRRQRSAERRRLPRVETDLHAFWCDYLVGRDRSLGIELLTTSSAYRGMMQAQLSALQLEAGQRVADLGSGTGSFALGLATWPERPPGLRVMAFDYVDEALLRSRDRLGTVPGGDALVHECAEVNLDLLTRGQRLPLADGCFDRVLASLLISYLEFPELVLEEAFRILRPGGRLVVSSLRRDADISRIYVDAYAELQVGDAGARLPELQAGDLGTMARSFLNDAAKILELEDSGAFHFWEPEELGELVAGCGFRGIECSRSLSHPPQAVLVSAQRP